MNDLSAAPVAFESVSRERFASSRSQCPDRAFDSAKSEPRCLNCEVATDRRWGVILAGGDGTRLLSLTRLICGDDRPKQFCNVFGRNSLVEETRQRAALSIAERRTIVALTETHEEFYKQELVSSHCPRLVQPRNRGTTPPILLSVMHIADRDPNALVAVLPSDHYYSDQRAFTESLESAFQLAGAHPDEIILLGAPPRGPEVDFGWIELGDLVGRNAFRVRAFEEKPSAHAAKRLFAAGGLWNTFVMVGSANAFLWMSFVSSPGLFATLNRSLPMCEKDGDLRVPSSVYEEIPHTDFSRQVLSRNTRRLVALRLEEVEWHDLGRPDRVISAVSSQGKILPAWIHSWRRATRIA